jgi:two-component system, OmpR family, response regulator ResD
VRTAILYADDEPKYLRLVRLFLEGDEYEVLTAEDGKAALAALGKRPDIGLVILDVMMPVMDGYAACRAIRSFSRVPVMMLTALGDETHEIRGLGGGADDYLPKPFSRDLLRARVRALLRRSRAESPASLTVGSVGVDLERREASVDGEAVPLSLREFELLVHLMRNAGAVCPRERLLDQVWGYGYEGDPRTLDTHIKSLRKKLKAGGAHISTCRGVGYSFKEAGA